MRTKVFLPVLIAFAVILGSCKEDNIRYSMSGVWEIQKVEITYYENGVAVKDTVAKDFGYFTLQDNDVGGQGECHYKFNAPGVIRSIKQVANYYTGLNEQDDYCWWSSGWYDNTRIELVEPGEYYDYFVTYTQNKLGRNKYEWTYIERGVDSLNAGSMTYKEIMTVKRVK